MLKSNMPKLMLQPLVENAIYHGVKERRDSNGVIRVCARLEDHALCLEVWDNGNIDQQRCDQLNDALFAQLDKLQAVDGDDADAMERAIEQTKAVSQLAGNIIANANTAISAMRLYNSAGMGAAELVGRAPKMLGGGE